MTLDVFDLTGRRALVTGASRGIGRAMARGLAEAGAHVFAVARTGPALEELALEIEGRGGRCDHLSADLTGLDAATTVMAAALDRLGGLDILINNAAVDVEVGAFDLAYDDFLRIMDFNVSSVFALTREAGRVFVEQGHGKVVNVTSVLSSVGVREDSAYIASKHTLLGLTRALAMEWGRHNVQVNALAPGFVITEMTRADWENEFVRKSVLRRTPLGRVAEPEDLVGAAVFLCSPASDFMTGSTLYVDGGWTAQ